MSMAKDANGKYVAKQNLDVNCVLEVNILRHSYLNIMKLENCGPMEQYVVYILIEYRGCHR
jgi:hypothetical protein